MRYKLAKSYGDKDPIAELLYKDPRGSTINLSRGGP